MRNARLLFLAGLVLAMSSTLLAIPQNQGLSKAQATKNDDGHRKHWWSPPHFHHKKQSSQTAPAQPSQTAQAKPLNHGAAPAHPGIKVSEKPASTAQKKPVKKTVASAAHPAVRSAHKHVAGTAHATRTTSKTVAATSHKKKTVRHNCSAEESKTGGCQARHSTKPATTRS